MHAWVDQSSVKKQKMPSMGNRTAYKFGNVKVCDLSDVYGAVLKKNSACKYSTGYLYLSELAWLR